MLQVMNNGVMIMNNISENSKLKQYFNKNINTIVLVGALIVLAIILSFSTNGIFTSFRNLSNLFRQMAVVTIVGSGIFMVILGGNIDLSVGSLVGLLGGIGAVAMARWGWETVPAILLMVFVGIVAGSFHGFLVSIVKVPAFIVTLGGYMAYKGLLIRVTNGATISNLNPSFAVIGQGYLSNVGGWIFAVALIALYIFLTLRKRKIRAIYNLENPNIAVMVAKIVILAALLIGFILLMNSYEGIPIPVMIMLGAVAGITIIAEKTSYGRSVYAMGGNREAARYSGINIKRVAFITFIISGLMASIGSIVYTARLNAATTQAGYLLEMDAIAAVVIGGTSLAGGVGRASKVILGAALMATIDNGMSLINLQSEWQMVVKGAVLVLAVTMDVLSNRKRV